jgi:23S rRNA (pseudouridine1915-N3)-methyltransferase
MEVRLIVVGRVRPPLADAVAEYEARAGRYFRFSVTELEPGLKGRGKAPPPADVMAAEEERILSSLDSGSKLIALTRDGRRWGSRDLAKFLEEEALASTREVAFAIGGAFGLGPGVLKRAQRTLTLSAMTLPHEMARLILAEQLYRAGTLHRGEPYHKGTDRIGGGPKQSGR